jgi:hypothetical protein
MLLSLPDVITSSPHHLPLMHPLQHLLLALWAGSLWTICGVVAPTLFAVLDRQAAGQLVGRFFAIVAWMGLAIAAILIGSRLRGGARRRPSIALIAATALAPVLSEVILGPLMHSARIAGDMQRFALLHGIAGLLFFVACVGVAAIVWLSQAE